MHSNMQEKLQLFLDYVKTLLTSTPWKSIHNGLSIVLLSQYYQADLSNVGKSASGESPLCCLSMDSTPKTFDSLTNILVFVSIQILNTHMIYTSKTLKNWLMRFFFVLQLIEIGISICGCLWVPLTFRKVCLFKNLK